MIPQSAPARVPSSLSQPSASATPNPSSFKQPPNGHAVEDEYDYRATGQESVSTPQASHMYSHQPYHPPFLPGMTTSPPPHTPTYVPPPQHALPPDPIHAMGTAPYPHAANPLNSTWSNGMGNGLASGGWRNGPMPQYAYRGPNGQGGSTMPEGYLQQQQRQAMMNSNGPRPTSASGEMRESRRRERSHRSERDDDGDKEGTDEVISTIFVVGFPDDMSEREFQNMFTFAAGFEAAMLKFPSSSSRSREPTAALLAELANLAAAQQAAIANGEQPDLSLPAPLEEALAALQLSNNTSSATTPSAALTPSAPSGAFGAGLPHLPTRRQTIGFARFRSRTEALAARDALQGKRVDAGMGGGTLKAEMAKKNLHTKRNAPSGGPGQEDTWRSRAGPSSSRAGQGKDWDQWFSTLPPAVQQQIQLAQSQASASSVQGHSDKSEAYNGYYDHPSASAGHAATSSQSVTSPQRPSDSKALLALAEEADELEGWSAVSMGMTMEGLTPGHNRPASSLFPGPSMGPSNGASTGTPIGAASGSTIGLTGTTNPTSPASSSLPLLSTFTASSNVNAPSSVHSAQSPRGTSQSLPQGINMYRPNIGANGYYASGGGSSGGEFAGSPPAESLDGRSAGPNPADQNPPINTLYVGNLPAMSPPTHPPNFLEESLRALFSRSPGYKRMSFRQKINGPMCFVEFEDVAFASMAIKELYGHNLGGLVKGGIRLSYSKNSLGQRGSTHPSGVNPSMFGGIAHTVALAGMSAPSGANGQSTTNGNLPGGPQSAPIPMPDAQRRQSEQSHAHSSGPSSGLSPTAQPFNATLPTSPRSRYFGAGGTGTSPQPESFHPAPASYSSSSAAQPIPLPSSSTSSASASAGGASGSAQFSPVSSPIRTPASFSWVSSGSTGGAVGNGGYGFDPFSTSAGTSMGGGGGGMSLGGAASAWQQGGQ